LNMEENLQKITNMFIIQVTSKYLERAISQNRIHVTLVEHFGDWVVFPLSLHPGLIPHNKISIANREQYVGLKGLRRRGHDDSHRDQGRVAERHE
jgi:hypothetical protein